MQMFIHNSFWFLFRLTIFASFFLFPRCVIQLRNSIGITIDSKVNNMNYVSPTLSNFFLGRREVCIAAWGWGVCLSVFFVVCELSFWVRHIFFQLFKCTEVPWSVYPSALYFHTTQLYVTPLYSTPHYSTLHYSTLLSRLSSTPSWSTPDYTTRHHISLPDMVSSCTILKCTLGATCWIYANSCVYGPLPRHRM